ncbi:MAG: fibronectin type III domain-containing protein [Bacteroidia bacterium]|nr:fibronectin type III domain-containing protein [Bacteroidia bacterium]
MKKSYLLRSGLFLFLLTAVCHTNVQAQLNYSFQQTTETYQALSGGTILGTANGVALSLDSALDSRVYTLPPNAIPFPFFFNGSGYTTLFVSSNGFITFGIAPSTTNVNPLGSTATYSGAVVGFGRDLIGNFKNVVPGDPDTIAQIRYGVTGSAPNRRFVVEWNNFRPGGGGSSLVPNMSFQIRLTEGSGVCEVAYGAFTGATWVNSTAQVGIRGATNTAYFNRLLASGQPWTNTSQGIAATSSCAFTSSTLPASGLVFRFMANCPTPSNLSILDLVANSVKLRWNSGSVAGTFPGSGYIVEWGPSGFTPGTGTIVNTNDTFLILSGLSSGTPYQYYVRRNCSSSGNGISVNAGPKSFTPGLPAEDCASAQLISVAANLASCSSTAVSSGSSQNGPNALCSDGLGGNFPDDDKWFKFVAPGNSKKIIITTSAGTVNDWVMEVWNNCPASGGLSIKCSDDVNGGMPEISLCQNEYIPGHTYYIRLWTYSLSGNGTMSFCAYEASPCPVAPSYDNCIAADSFLINPVLSCPGNEQIFSTLFATPSVGGDNTADAPTCDGSTTLNDVWLRFNTGSTGTFTVTLNPLTATDLRAQVVFECGSGGYEIACWNPAAGTHTLTGLNPSANYAIRVWSAVGQSGTFSVCAQDACDDATATLSGSSTICTTGTAQLRVDLTGLPPWNVTYTDGVSNYNFTTSTTPYFISVSPQVTTFYNLVSVSSPICSGTGDGVASVNVVPPPVVDLAAFTSPVCSNQIFTLSGGTPVGGTYSGIGVTGNQFNASVGGLGPHLITYTYGIGNGCQRSDTASIQVIQAPSVTYFNPAVAPVGSTIKIGGSHLNTVNQVRFNLTNALVYNILSSDTITAVVPPGANTGYITVFTSNGCSAQSPTTFGVGNPPGVTLNLKAYVEGYYASGGLMNAVVDPINLPTKSDTMTVELHSPLAPYALVATRKALSNTNGTFTVTFPAAQTNNSYYIVLKSRNTVETWSKVPVLLVSGNNSYDFSVPGTSMLRPHSQSGGSNLQNGSVHEFIKPEHPE